MKLLTKTAAALALLSAAVMTDAAMTGPALADEVVKTASGSASWYGPRFHGRKTANGERFDQNALTAAHRTLPFGTKVKVTCLNSGKSVTVRINDRGPFHGNRVIDLSRAAARQIGIMSAGVGKVDLEILA